MAMVNSIDTRRSQGFTGSRCEEFHSVMQAIGKAGSENSNINKEGKQVYHTSSNGYYGYLPRMSDNTNDLPMDTSDSELTMKVEGEPVIDRSVEMPPRTINLRSLNETVSLGRRKRISGDDSAFTLPKKQRKEEQESMSKNGESCQNFIRAGHDLDLVERLLKLTHGCDLYHYISYDL